MKPWRVTWYRRELRSGRLFGYLEVEHMGWTGRGWWFWRVMVTAVRKGEIRARK